VNYYCRTSPEQRLMVIFHSFACSWESPPSIWFKTTRKPGYTGLVRDSRVRDWL